MTILVIIIITNESLLTCSVGSIKVCMSPQLEPLLITYHMMMMVVNLVNKMIGVENLLLILVS